MRLLIFWDSITEWYKDYKMWGWANRLKIYLWQLKTDVSAVNYGFSGFTTQDVIGILDSFTKPWVSHWKQVAFLFAVGINDSMTNANTSQKRFTLQQFEQNISELINLAQKYNPGYIKFLWLTKVNEELVYPRSEDGGGYQNVRIQKFDDILRQTATQNNCWYLKIFDLLSQDDLEDGLHPNPEGHQKIFERVKEFVLN